jgi:membrane-associated protein
MEYFYTLILTYKYLIILPIAIIEGPSISIIAGALIATGHLNAIIVYILIVLGDVVGDTLYYCLGRFGGVHSWLGSFLKIDSSKITKLEKVFKNDGPKFLFVGKTQGLGAVVLIAGGIAKYPYRLFIFYNTLATLLKSFVLLVIGFYFSKQYIIANGYITKIGIVLTFAFVVASYFYIRKKFKS